jgi:hypothetical protein
LYLGLADYVQEEGQLEQSRNWFVLGLVVVVFVASAATLQATNEIIHDAEHHLLEAQHGEKWAAEDKEIDAKLAEFEKKHGRRPNIIHIM